MDLKTLDTGLSALRAVVSEAALTPSQEYDLKRSLEMRPRLGRAKKGAVWKAPRASVVAQARDAIRGLEAGLYQELIPFLEDWETRRREELTEFRRAYFTGLSKKDIPRSKREISDRLDLPPQKTQELLARLASEGLALEVDDAWVRAPGSKFPDEEESIILDAKMAPIVSKMVKSLSRFMTDIKEMSGEQALTSGDLAELRRLRFQRKRGMISPEQEQKGKKAIKGGEVSLIPLLVAQSIFSKMLYDLGKEPPSVSVRSAVDRLLAVRDHARMGLGMKLTKTAEQRVKNIDPDIVGI